MTVERIFGKIIKKTNDFVVIEKHDIGYKLHISKNTEWHLKEGNSTTLFVSSYNHSDGTSTYYGFYEEEERDLFERLLKINGVGGHTALSLMVDVFEKVLEAIEKRDYGFFHGHGFKEKTITMVFKNFR